MVRFSKRLLGALLGRQRREDVGNAVSAVTSTLTAASFAPDADGSTTDTLTYTARDEHGTALANRAVTMTVYRTFVDAGTSVIATEPDTIEDDGAEFSTLTTTARDTEGTLLPGIPGANVVLASSGTGNTVTQPSDPTDGSGETSGTITSTVAETKEITSTVLGLALTIPAELIVSGSVSSGLFDTRAGQAQSIQTSATFGDAETASTLNLITKYYPDFTWGPWGWDTDFDGSGTHAFRIEIQENAGNSTCEAGGGSMQSFQIEKQLGGVGGEGVVLHIEYKQHLGKTAGGGGIGSTGAWSDGGKKLILFRRNPADNTFGNQGRLTAAGSDAYESYIMSTITSEPLVGSAQDPRSANASDIRTSSGLLSPTEGNWIDWSDYAGQTVTVKYEIKTETTAGAGDGYFKWYLNGTMMMNLETLYTGTVGWGWMQLGGPTWVCPPQDQTAYFYDLRAWTVG